MKTKTFLLTFFITTLTMLAHAQDNTIWTAFYNKKATAIGYKDQKGNIKIKPKFTLFSPTIRFENIMAVSEEDSQGRWKSYYLTKKGKTVGIDSLHIFDHSFDCENEGFIRFRDNKTDKAGLFDKNGAIAIPAQYNDLSRVSNGLVTAIAGAEKTYTDDREHYAWTGGQEFLLDTHNNVIVEDFKPDDSLNFFSLLKAPTASTDPLRTSFLTKDGAYISFINFKEEFKQWLTTDLLIDLTDKKLINASFDVITWDAPILYEKTKREAFIAANFELIKKGLLEILNPKTNYFISNGGINRALFDDEAFDKYYNNCGESTENKNPTMTIIVSHTIQNELKQNQYEFLKTETDYKLIGVFINDAPINNPTP